MEIRINPGVIVINFDYLSYLICLSISGVANYSLDKLVDDVKDVVHSLGKQKCILVSHDWGGLIGWTVAAHYPELVDRFIVCNAPNVMQWKTTIESDWQQFKMSWY